MWGAASTCQPLDLLCGLHSSTPELRSTSRISPQRRNELHLQTSMPQSLRAQPQSQAPMLPSALRSLLSIRYQLSLCSAATCAAGLELRNRCYMPPWVQTSCLPLHRLTHTSTGVGALGG